MVLTCWEIWLMGMGEAAADSCRKATMDAQRQPAHAADAPAAPPITASRHVLQVAQVAHDGAHDVAQLVGFVCLNVQRVVAAGRIRPGRWASWLNTFTTFWPLTISSTKPFSAPRVACWRHEIPGGFRADLLGDQHHHHHKGQGEDRQINVQQNHVHQHRHHRNGRGNQLRYGWNR